MIKITVNFQLNASKEEAKKLKIDDKAKLEFMSEGFSEGLFEVQVTSGIYPRHTDPHFLSICIDAIDILGDVVVIIGVIKALKKYCKKQKGYFPDVSWFYKKNKYIILDLEKTNDELITEITKSQSKLKKEQTNKDKIKKFIDRGETFYCDDCLSEELGIYPRQTINSNVRKLANEIGYRRGIQKCEKCMKNKKILYK